MKTFIFHIISCKFFSWYQLLCLDFIKHTKVFIIYLRHKRKMQTQESCCCSRGRCSKPINSEELLHLCTFKVLITSQLLLLLLFQCILWYVLTFVCKDTVVYIVYLTTHSSTSEHEWIPNLGVIINNLFTFYKMT